MKLTRKDWHKLIDEFMGLHSRSTLDWDAVLGLEGGYGQEKIKNIEDAIKPENEGTWPYIWFKSDQKDYSVYNRYDYIYSLLFGRQISGGTIKMVIDDLLNRSLWTPKFMLIDWGGSAFTAKDLLDGDAPIKGVYTVNFKGPQMDFAMWYFTEKVPTSRWFAGFEDGLDSRHMIRKTLEVVELPIVWLFSEVLEHVKSPLEYWDNLCAEFDINDAYIANSFCTPAYGHHVPIIMDGKECHTVRIANKAWREGMKKRGYILRKMEGWNSRLFHCTKT